MTGYLWRMSTAALLGACLSGHAVAADDADGLVTITPRQDKAEADAAALAAAEADDKEDSLIGPIHGSVSAMVGTGGARAFYGTVDIPIGENGMVSLSYGEGQNLPYSDVYPGYGAYGHRYGWLAPFDTGWAGRTIRQRDGR
jgi:hypothetical protein